MLSSLTLRNFMLLDDLTLPLYEGFTVITGETGAGKSLLLLAIRALCGGKLTQKMFKNDGVDLVIIGVFIINDSLFDELGSKGITASLNELIVKRIFSKNGRNRYFINDQPVSAQCVVQVVSGLLDISTQYEHFNSFGAQYYLDMIDSVHGEDTSKLRELYMRIKDIKGEIAEIEQAQKLGAQEREYRSNMLHELKALSVLAGEVESLQNARIEMRNNKKFASILEQCSKNFAELSQNNITSITRELAAKEGFEHVVEKLHEAQALIDDAESTFHKRAAAVSYDEIELESLEDRLFLLKDVARKYHINEHSLFEHYEHLAAQQDEFSHSVEKLQEKQLELEKEETEYLSIANEISKKRVGAAKKLSKDLEGALTELNLKDVSVRFDVHSDDCNISASGIDTVRCLVRTNPDMPYGDLEKTTSGGEFSRIVLALKSVIACDGASVFFDEIDVGVSGATAYSVGKKLMKIGASTQVVAITHQAQVAACADRHILVEKKFVGEETEVSARYIEAEEVEREVAKMISGDQITSESSKAATVLIEDAKSVA